MIAIDVPDRNIAGCCDNPCCDGSMNVCKNVPQELMLDAHAQHAAADDERRNFAVYNNGAAG